MLTTHNTHTKIRELAENRKAHKHLRNLERKLSGSLYLNLYEMEENTDVTRSVDNVPYSRECS